MRTYFHIIKLIFKFGLTIYPRMAMYQCETTPDTVFVRMWRPVGVGSF